MRKIRGFSYPAELLPEDGGQFTVRFPDLPEAITFGEDHDDAVVEAADCLEEAIAGRITDGLELPRPSRIKGGQVAVSLSGSMAAKAALCLSLREAGITRRELALRLGVDEREVRRMLDPRHPTKLPRIEQALAVLGKRLIVSLDTEAA